MNSNIHQQTRVELQQENGIFATGKPKRASGRHTFVVTDQQLTNKVSRIRVMGCEDQTCAEKARHQFLRFSLSNLYRRDVPFFVKAIWFPKNLKGPKGHRNASTKTTVYKPSHLLERLNISQRGVATAMLSVSGCDSLVVVHGILHEFLNPYPHRNTHGIFM
jgi:hypothetical protein